MRQLVAEILDELDLHPRKRRKHKYAYKRKPQQCYRSKYYGRGERGHRRREIVRRIVLRLIGGKSYPHGRSHRPSKRYRRDYDD